jgi:hypothetical protein
MTCLVPNPLNPRGLTCPASGCGKAEHSFEMAQIKGEPWNICAQGFPVRVCPDGHRFIEGGVLLPAEYPDPPAAVR